MPHNERSVWTEHVSKDGRRYFYNQRTKKSQWEKPDELKSEQELKIEAKTRWKSYETADGKVFYYNSETKESVWEIPEEVRQLLEDGESLASTARDNTRDAFLRWLEGFNFTQKVSWDGAVKILEANEGWSNFSMLTRGEKKQLFSEFSSQIYRREQEELRRKKGMLSEIIARELSNWEDLQYYTTYVEFAKKFHKSEWWDWSSERERDDIFQDCVLSMEKELKRRQKEKRANSIDKLIESMTKFFKDSENDEDLPVWAKVKEHFTNFEGLHLTDVLACHKCVFRDFYRKKLKEAERRCFRIQRKCRGRFISFLEDCVKKGEINAKTDFSDFIKHHSTEAVYLDMVGQPGSTPYDLFREVQYPLKELYRKHRDIVSHLIHEGKLQHNAPIEEYESVAASNGINLGANLPLVYSSLARGGYTRKHPADAEEGEITRNHELSGERSPPSVESMSSASLDHGRRHKRRK